MKKKDYFIDNLIEFKKKKKSQVVRPEREVARFKKIKEKFMDSITFSDIGYAHMSKAVTGYLQELDHLYIQYIKNHQILKK